MSPKKKDLPQNCGQATNVQRIFFFSPSFFTLSPLYFNFNFPLQTVFALTEYARNNRRKYSSRFFFLFSSCLSVPLVADYVRAEKLCNKRRKHSCSYRQGWWYVAVCVAVCVAACCSVLASARLMACCSVCCSVCCRVLQRAVACSHRQGWWYVAVCVAACCSEYISIYRVLFTRMALKALNSCYLQEFRVFKYFSLSFVEI